MNRGFGPSIVLALLLSLTASVTSPAGVDEVGLTIHEWGTFTSIAGEAGEPLAWRTYGGPSDLPCFVERFSGFKGGLLATVRMETPVLYFYGTHDISANVKVLFPKGTITEWYPRASVSRAMDAIEWRQVRATTNAKPDFPKERARSL